MPETPKLMDERLFTTDRMGLAGDPAFAVTGRI
jgi:hypothetical protein